MGQTVSTGTDNDELIDNLVEADYIKNLDIQRIFRAVDRANYFLNGQKDDAYRDSAWRVGNLHLSAPCVYSGVMESLKLRRGLSFLNLGSGCGYLSTMAGLVLGPYGVNHGIEIYKDVVDYAYDRLDDFMKQSDAVDEYDFCEPTFVNGNCLKIDNLQLYDRVYCGAACPLEHEMYMRHLIKIGGILVIPLNNKLLQITRTGDSTWESVMILSVSFAPLVSPSETESVSFVKLPEFSPPSLQVLCRSKIRTVLRSRIDDENPGLQEKKRDRCRICRHVRSIVIPLIDESDSSDSGSNTDIDFIDLGSSAPKITVGSYKPTRATAFIKSFIRARTEIQGVVAGPSNWTGSSVSTCSSRNSTTTTNNNNNQASAANESDAENNAKEDEDSNDSDSDMNSEFEKFHDSDSDSIYSASFFCETDKSNTTSPSSPKSNNNSASKKQTSRKRRHSGSEPSKSKCRRRITFPSTSELKSRIASVICKRLPSSEVDLEKKKKAAAENTDRDALNYQNLMAKKILSLPLPLPVQKYINYRRDNFNFVNN